MIGKTCFLVLQVVLFCRISVMCDITNDKYNYLLFENFEMTKQCFINEQKIISVLRVIKKSLRYKLNELNYWENNKAPSLVGLDKQQIYKREFRSRMHITLNYIATGTNIPKEFFSKEFQPQQHEFDDKYNYLLDFENIYRHQRIDIIKGVLRGLIMLQETFEQDIQWFSKGHLRLKSNIDLSSRNVDSLKPDDLAVMSTLAFDFYKWYDNSLRYLKDALQSFYSIPYEKKITGRVIGGLEKYLLEMKLHYSAYHNQLWRRKNNILGNGWKLYPDIVVEGI